MLDARDILPHFPLFVTQNVRKIRYKGHMCPKDSTVVGIINTVFETAADDGRMNYSAKENLQRYEVQGRKYEVLKSGGRSPAEFTTFNISTNYQLLE